MSYTPIIKCDAVYKIFGVNAQKMLQDSNGNVDAKTFQENGCIVGVNNASFEVSKGEMLVVMGSEYEIDTENKILFIEDVGESPYRVDRYLQELKLAGKFNELKGVIIGRFSRRDSEGPDKLTDFKMEEVFNQYFSNFNVPVIYDFPSGHGAKNISIPLGVIAEINTEDQIFRLLENPLKN